PISRVLVGGTRLQDPWQVPRDPWGPQLLVGPFLRPLEPQAEAEAPEGALRNLLNFLTSNSPSSSSSPLGLGWSVGSPWQEWARAELRLQQLLLLWGLPGTPVLSYGDEVGLQRPPENQELPAMPWESIEGPSKGGNGSQPPDVLELCKTLASLRAQERSLLLGEAVAVPAGAAIAVLRRWDQSQRFLLLLNPHGAPVKPFAVKRDPPEPVLPPKATLRLSTDPSQPKEREVALDEVTLAAFEGLLLSFPYTP
ncbi:amino acid transporter heavy chain SLC3A2-like, partial [Aphelocoma coerulescens]|uniref:amino acid transporter heavy chain SLC3A2-like n=1 Tax=Aphelocoma coerulescens TaxID=39617 RepID=UPI003604A1C7